MSGSDSPQLWAVTALLSNIIVSVATMWYIWMFVLQCSTCVIAPLGIILILAFGVIFILSGFSLVLTLMPARRRFCPACTLITKIMEIEVQAG
jgi:hypothetical protein